MLKKAQNFARALRLPFITASTLPFIFGSLINRSNFNLLNFFLGLCCVAATHLSANLINDYADSQSGADWQDRNFYKFFGGSKLIQEKVLSEKFYLKTAIFFAIIAVFCAILLSIFLKSLLVISLFTGILILSWLYSKKPLQFSYHRLGEIIIFLLFGPVTVMGGYFIQTGIFPDLKSFLLSLPFAFLTAAILFANEIPDFQEDKGVGKFTWVSIFGEKKSFLLYALIVFFAFFFIFLNLTLGYLKPIVFLSLIFVLPALKACSILKKHPHDKMRLIGSSKITIALQTIVGIVLILGVL
ncbi:MAG: prenyltransferase [Candidatus Omnitrophica bacterium]|nr:prenyltransferase [Candidatus Omnitrophota bacterium]